MLIHITPRIYLKYRVASCELASLTIKEFGLTLTAKDLDVRKPYPNKNFRVACRRTGQKAIEGLLLKTEHPIASFTVNAQWVIDGCGEPFTHLTNYQVLDSTHESVSDNMVLWHADAGRKWGARWAPAYAHLSPAQAAPRMEIFPHGPGASDPVWHRHDIVGEDGFIEKRTEHFQMLTIEPQRLFAGTFSDRMPTLESALLVNQLQPQMEPV